MKHLFYFSALIFFGIVACSADQPATSLYGEEPKQASPPDPVSCRDANGNPVDWWVILKGPGVKKGGKKLPNQYLYRDSTSNDCSDSSGVTDCWQFNGPPIAASSGNALSETLKQSYGRSDLSRIYYNDETCDAGLDNKSCYQHSGTSSGAHSKGVTLFDREQGFYLTHSFPRFPKEATPTTLAYGGVPESLWWNGQHAFCMTLSWRAQENISKQLGMIQVNTYATQNVQIRSGFSYDSTTSNLVTFSPTNTASYTLLNNETITHHAKNAPWGKDIFQDLIAPALKSDLWAQTWRTYFKGEGGPNNFPDFCKTSNCSQTKLLPNKKDLVVEADVCFENPTQTFEYNIQTVDLVWFNDEIKWSTCADHSKWAITAPGSPSKNVIFADNNRSLEQRHRGGGAFVFQNDGLWNAFKKLVESMKPCSPSRKKALCIID